MKKDHYEIFCGIVSESLVRSYEVLESFILKGFVDNNGRIG